MSKNFYAHGKLLLSGEYFVLDGAKALAIPTRFGQHLEIIPASGEEGKLYWEALDEKGEQILSVIFELTDFKALEKKGEVSHFLLQDILRAVRVKNPEFLNQRTNIHAVSRLEFHPGWGLGSSSTLVYNIASWAKVDALDLFFNVLQGSGYDVACAAAKEAILYHLEGNQAVWRELCFEPPFAKQLYFVYLGKKQNSNEAVRKFRNAPHNAKVTEQISSITERMLRAITATEFRALMEEHETVVASALRLEKVKDLHFKDFPGSIKSLGAWGGDFVMALAENKQFDTVKYFIGKGFETVFPFEEVLFKPLRESRSNVKTN